jgi:hypothetical protein
LCRKEETVDREASDVVDRLASGWESQDWPSVAGLYAEQGFVYEDFASHEHYDNRRDLLDICLAETSKIPEFSFERRGISVGDEVATLEWVMRGLDPWCDNKPWEAQGVDVLEIRDGLIVRDTKYYNNPFAQCAVSGDLTEV